MWKVTSKIEKIFSMMLLESYQQYSCILTQCECHNNGSQLGHITIDAYF